MTTRKEQMQRLIRRYKDETSEREIDMKNVARWAAGKGWSLPRPPTALDLLAKQFSEAAREETRRDPETGESYRANHAIKDLFGGVQTVVWIDIDEAPRRRMLKSLVQRREQMIGDGYHLTIDADRWNRVHPDEEPIQMILDFTDDVLWRRNAPKGDKAA